MQSGQKEHRKTPGVRRDAPPKLLLPESNNGIHASFSTFQVVEHDLRLAVRLGTFPIALR